MTSQNEVYAALDLGTNNCRLLVARPTSDGFRVIDAFSRIVRLGEGLATNGQLSEAAMARTLEALKICAGKMRRRKVTRARCVATEACRQAANCDAFVARVDRETGLGLEIISHSEEASLGLFGCTPLLDPTVPHAIIFDIGGGSTEVSWLEVPAPGEDRTGEDRTGEMDGALPAVVDWCSLPLGVVSLAERYGGIEVSERLFLDMVAEVTAAIDCFEAKHGLANKVAEGQVQMLGTSGTVTTLSGVHKGLLRYDRARVDGSYLDFDTISALSRELAGMTHLQRAGQACIGPERADLVVAGCAILEAICRTWPVGRLRVADRGLREGILCTLMQAQSRRFDGDAKMAIPEPCSPDRGDHGARA